MSEPTCGLWSTSTTRAAMSGNSAVSRAGSSQAVSMPVSPAPTTTAVAAAGVCGPPARAARCRCSVIAPS